MISTSKTEEAVATVTGESDGGSPGEAGSKTNSVDLNGSEGCGAESKGGAKGEAGVDAKTESQAGSQTGTQNPHFIHKLYSMLEDEDLKDLIWWSASADSFLIRPTERFSKALSAYFKHTNIASFVRQLNMYGFQKVSDHKPTWNVNIDETDESSINLWEFKHSSGYFRKGDKESLKSIKRRSSKYHIPANRKNSNSNVSTPTASAQESTWNEYSQQPRSNSYTSNDMIGVPSPAFTSQGPAAGFPPGTYSAGFVSPADYANMGPNALKTQQIDSKVFELNQSITGLRNEHVDLQHRYEIAVEELRATNSDMIKMLDIVQRTLLERKSGAPADSTSESNGFAGTAANGLPRPNTPLGRSIRQDSVLSPGSKLPLGSTKNLNDLNDEMKSSTLNDISKFRESIFARFQKFHESLQNSISVMDLKNQPFTSVTHGLGSAIPHSPAAQLPNQHLIYNNVITPSHQFPSNPPSQLEQQHVNLMMNPFARRKSSGGSSKKRHMSVLMDPLAPAPQQTQQHSHLPLIASNTIEQQISMQQTSPYHQPSSKAVSRNGSRQDARYVPTSNPNAQNPEIKRPFSPISDSYPYYSPSQKQHKSQNNSSFSQHSVHAHNLIHQQQQHQQQYSVQHIPQQHAPPPPPPPPQQQQQQQHHHYQQQQQQQQSFGQTQGVPQANVISYKPHYPYGTMPVPNFRPSQLYSNTPGNSISGNSSVPSEYGLTIDTPTSYVTNGPQTPINIIRPIPAKMSNAEVMAEMPTSASNQHLTQLPQTQLHPQQSGLLQHPSSLLNSQPHNQGQLQSQAQTTPSSLASNQNQAHRSQGSSSGLHLLLSHDAEN